MFQLQPQLPVYPKLDDLSIVKFPGREAKHSLVLKKHILFRFQTQKSWCKWLQIKLFFVYLEYVKSNVSHSNKIKQQLQNTFDLYNPRLLITPEWGEFQQWVQGFIFFFKPCLKDSSVPQTECFYRTGLYCISWQNPTCDI